MIILKIILIAIGSLLVSAVLLLVILHFYYLSMKKRLAKTMVRIPVNGKIGFYSFSTTVDSEEAKYHLERNNGGEVDLEMEERIQRVRDMRIPGEELRTFLGTVSQEISHDYSAIYFAEEVLSDPENHAAQKRMRQKIDQVRGMTHDELMRDFKSLEGFKFVFVPGFGYKFVKDLDASFKATRAIMQEAGLDVYMIETDGVGLCEDNAVLIANEIRRLSKEHDNLVLVSASKGGPEVGEALGSLLGPEECGAVKMWISIGGALRGSPLVDRLVKWHSLFYLKTMTYVMSLGRTKVLYETLSTKHRLPGFLTWKFPPHIFLSQVIPVALSGQFSSRIKANYRKVEKFGPNDGSTMLADQILPDSQVLLYFGLDHCFGDPDIDRISVAILQTVVDTYRELHPHSPQTSSM